MDDYSFMKTHVFRKLRQTSPALAASLLLRNTRGRGVWRCLAVSG